MHSYDCGTREQCEISDKPKTGIIWPVAFIVAQLAGVGCGLFTLHQRNAQLNEKLILKNQRRQALDHICPPTLYGKQNIEGEHCADGDDVCCICLDSFEDTVVRTLPCAHLVHRDCFDSWCTSRPEGELWVCPLCKTSPFPTERAIPMSQSVAVSGRAVQTPAPRGLSRPEFQSQDVEASLATSVPNAVDLQTSTVELQSHDIQIPSAASAPQMANFPTSMVNVHVAAPQVRDILTLAVDDHDQAAPQVRAAQVMDLHDSSSSALNEVVDLRTSTVDVYNEVSGHSTETSTPTVTLGHEAKPPSVINSTSL